MTDEKNNNCKYLIEPLDKKHNKIEFSCGSVSLDQYLKTQAGQDIKKNVAVTHALTAEKSEKILGFYTLSSIGIFPGDLPEDIIKKLPRYPVLPGVLLGRLAVDQKYQGKGLGLYLLMDAFKRSLVISSQMGIVAVIVDAKDESAIAFYKQYGFIALPDNRHRLFVTLGTLKQLDL